MSIITWHCDHIIRYAGPFDVSHRHKLLRTWTDAARASELPANAQFSLVKTVGEALEIREWAPRV